MTDTSCPVCGRGLTGSICPDCGFDRSLDAEQYPSLFRELGGKLRPVNVLRREYEEKTAPKAEAKSLEDPEKLYRRALQTTDVLERVELLSQASFQGHVLAQTALGMLYREQGKMKLAADLFQKAAVGKNGEACYQLSHCYRDGLGVKTSASSAIHWLRRAAELGQVKAVLELADALLAGGDLEKDPVKAEEYYQKAAKMGAPEGLVHLAWCYRDGKYVPKSRTKAWELLNQASKYGSTEAGVLLHSPEFQPAQTQTGTTNGSTQTKTGTTAGTAQTKAGTTAGSTQTKTGTTAGTAQTKAGTTAGSTQTKTGTTAGSTQTKTGTGAGTTQTKAGTTAGTAQTKTGTTAGTPQTKTGTTAGSTQTKKTGTTAGTTQTKAGTTAGTTQTKTGTTAGAEQPLSSWEKRKKALEGKTLKQLKIGRIWRGILFYWIAPIILLGIISEFTDGWIRLRDLLDMILMTFLCVLLGRSYFLYRSVYRKRTGQGGKNGEASHTLSFRERRAKELERKSSKQLIFGITWRVVLFLFLLVTSIYLLFPAADEGGIETSDLLIVAVYAVGAWLCGWSYSLFHAVYRKRIGQSGKNTGAGESLKQIRFGMIWWGVLSFSLTFLLISILVTEVILPGERSLNGVELSFAATLPVMIWLFGRDYFFDRSVYKRLSGQAGNK